MGEYDILKAYCDNAIGSPVSLDSTTYYPLSIAFKDKTMNLPMVLAIELGGLMRYWPFGKNIK